MPAVIVESKEPLRVSVSNVNPIASGVVHAMTRPEAFVIIFSCWLSIWRRLRSLMARRLSEVKKSRFRRGAVVFGEPANIVLARTDRGHVEEVAAIRQVVLDLGLDVAGACLVHGN